MFTFEIERKPVFFLCKLVFGGRKKVFFLCGKQCGYGSQALFGFRTSVLRVKRVPFLYVSCMFM